MTQAATSSVDFSVIGRVNVNSARQLVEWFASRAPDAPRVRIAGRLSRQREVPAPETPVQIVSLAGMDRILRLEPDDLTCTVQAGVTRAELDAELSARGLWLPCEPGTGSIGATFSIGSALGEAPGPAGCLPPRALLLGMSGVLAEGLAFKVGARVVKSVAGFDLHKLFVGSRGRLFAATELHLKLRPRPRCSVAFCNRDPDPAVALALFDRLRRDDAPPSRLWLCREKGAFAVRGRCDGAPRVVADRVRRHALIESDDRIAAVVGAPERVAGSLPPSRAQELIARLPAEAALRIAGTGRFEVALVPGDADRLLVELPDIDGCGEIDRASADRRGRATALDPGAARLAERLRAELDPKGVLR